MPDLTFPAPLAENTGTERNRVHEQCVRWFLTAGGFDRTLTCRQLADETLHELAQDRTEHTEFKGYWFTARGLVAALAQITHNSTSDRFPVDRNDVPAFFFRTQDMLVAVDPERICF